MIRRLVAAATLATAVLGGIVAVAAPSQASEHEGQLCIGTEDQGTPGYGRAICLKDVVPGQLIDIPSQVIRGGI